MLAVRSVLIGWAEATCKKNREDKRSTGEFIQFISILLFWCCQAYEDVRGDVGSFG